MTTKRRERYKYEVHADTMRTCASTLLHVSTRKKDALRVLRWMHAGAENASVITRTETTSRDAHIAAFYVSNTDGVPMCRYYVRAYAVEP